MTIAKRLREEPAVDLILAAVEPQSRALPLQGFEPKFLGKRDAVHGFPCIRTPSRF